MNSSVFMILFDVIVVVLGIGTLLSALKMKKNNTIPVLFVSSEEIKNCNDVNGFIKFLFPKAIIFSIICIVFGALSFVNDAIVQLNNLWSGLMLGAFLVGWFWFSKMIRKGKESYFKTLIM